MDIGIGPNPRTTMKFDRFMFLLTTRKSARQKNIARVVVRGRKRIRREKIMSKYKKDSVGNHIELYRRNDSTDKGMKKKTLTNEKDGKRMIKKLN